MPGHSQRGSFGAIATARTLCLSNHWDQITPCFIPLLTTCGTADACSSSPLLCRQLVRTDVMGSVRIKCALLSKLEPYGAPDPEPDDWMRKAETCRLYELAPTPRLFVRPITAILGKVPMVCTGNTGTIPFSMRGHERAYYPGGRCDSAVDKGDGSRLWYVNTWAMKWSQKE